MVSIRGLLFAASLLLSGVAATPFPVNKQSVAAPDVQAINDFFVESRGLHEDASKNKRGLLVPAHPDVPPPLARLDGPPTRKVVPGRTNSDGEALGAKPATPARLGKEDKAAPMCRRLLPRNTLFRRGNLVPAADITNIRENEYVTANKLKKGDIPAVTNLSGCTALFFYNAANVPSIFHITCGEEKRRAREAAAMVNEIGADANGVRIKAGDKEHFQKAALGIKEANPDIVIRNSHVDKYNAAISGNNSGKRTKLTAGVGHQNIVESDYRC